MTTTWSWRAVQADEGSEGIHLDLHVEPQGHWPAMLGRIGVTMGLPDEWSTVSWFGLGPTENYPDSQHAATWGRWNSDVASLQTPYVLRRMVFVRVSTSLRSPAPTVVCASPLMVAGRHSRFARGRPRPCSAPPIPGIWSPTGTPG